MKHAFVLLAVWMLLSPGVPVFATEAPAPAASPDWLLEIAAQSKPEVQMTVTSPTDPIWLRSIQANACNYCPIEECGCCACVWSPVYGCCWYCC
jgi:hypothetical protein